MEMAYGGKPRFVPAICLHVALFVNIFQTLEANVYVRHAYVVGYCYV